MFDIDALVFGTKKKSKPMPKLKTDGFKSFNLLGGSSRHFIIGDKITPKQRVMIRKDPFSDYDKDGVINGLDCQPRNRKKHMGRYLSTRFRDVSYSKDPMLNHERLDPFSYNQEGMMGGLKKSPIRFSTKQEAITDSYNAALKKEYSPNERVTVHAGDEDEWLSNMKDSDYKQRFMKGISVLQKVDKVSDQVPVYSSAGNRLGKIGQIKNEFGEEDVSRAYETKYMPTSKLIEMRAKHGHNTIPMTPKRETYTMERMSASMKAFGPEPIRTNEKELAEDKIEDGKHRLILAEQQKRQIYPIQIEKDLEDKEDV